MVSSKGARVKPCGGTGERTRGRGFHPPLISFLLLRSFWLFLCVCKHKFTYLDVNVAFLNRTVDMRNFLPFEIRSGIKCYYF